jgi:glycosyltransferase involved in cell wall biosynthesis
MPLPNELAFWLPKGQVAPPVNPYGRLVANAGVYRALARHGGYQHLHFQSQTPPAPEQLAMELGLGDGDAVVTTGPLLSTSAAARAGILLSGQPYLAEPAWVRRHAGCDADYSIVGTIFAFASATHRERMLNSALAPLHEWDALICSSPTLRQTVEQTLDTWEDYLRERLGAARLPRPQLPVIPFGTDVDALEALASDGAARASQRESLGIAPDDAMVYYLGRLSYVDKAFPQAMFKVIETAAVSTGVRTHFVLAGWFAGGDADRVLFEDAARLLAPHVTTTILDGNDAALVARCWSAADVFFQLSDTILETFGQAPVEAMAVGLPLVVSDWDGFRSIVRDGIDGFLVPSLGSPGGPLGDTLALLQTLDQVGYPQYMGSVAQHTAIHIGSAVTALSALLASPELRRSMGAAGQRRARELFAWPVVTAQYVDLFADLAARREQSMEARGVPEANHRMNPLRGDPFAGFRGLASRVLSDDMPLELASRHTSEGTMPDASIELEQMFPALRGSAAEAQQLIDLMRGAGPLTLHDLLQSFPPNRRPFVRMSVLWLAKAGVVDWLPQD